MGRQGTVDDPEVLPYYMEAVESGYKGTRKRGPRNMPEEEEIPGEVSHRDSINIVEQGDTGEGSGEAAGVSPLEEHSSCTQDSCHRTLDEGGQALGESDD